MLEAEARDDQRVVDLSLERERRRVQVFRVRMQGLSDSNKRAISKLFSSGVIFTRQGTRAGRNLLAAHQNLMKVSDLLGQLEEIETHPRGLNSRHARTIVEKLETLLQRSRALCSRTDDLLSSLRQ